MSNPPPIPNDSRPVWDRVIEDMRGRDATGRRTYGTPLQAFNGRDALKDAYEEALDLAVYLKQAIIERDAARKDICLLGAYLRVFYRPWHFPWRPYAFHKWGFYGFGVGPVGFMFWPPQKSEGRDAE